VTTAEQNKLVLTWQRFSFEFPDGAKSRLLFRLTGVRAPKIYTICAVVDCSDSYDKAIQEISTLRKAISRWPSDWVVHFFQLSSPEILATQTIAEFCKGEDLVERHFEPHSNQIPSQCRGSFLRPCIEAITWKRSTETDPGDQIVFVLGDGQFTDFLPVILPDWMKLVVTSNLVRIDGVACFEHMRWGTKTQIDFTNSYIPRFDGDVPLAVTGAPQGTRFFSVTNNELQEWRKPGETEVDVKRSVATFLIDCEPEHAHNLKWCIRSTGELVRLHMPVASSFPDESRLREVINAGLRNVKQKPPYLVLFESQTGRHNHHEVQSFFEAAEAAANMRNKWSLTDVSNRFNEFVRSADESHDVHSTDAVLVLAAEAHGTAKPDQLIAIGLSKSEEFRMSKGDCIGTFSVLESFKMSFNRELRRWRLSVSNQQDLDLGASSQVVELPIAYESLNVRILFSKAEWH
jgi:hypothetical protein